MASSLASQPPPTPTYALAYPAPHVLLITIDRPKAMNSLPWSSHWEAHALLEWFDSEPSLRVAVITGTGDKAFCAGQDLIEQSTIAMKVAKGEELPPRQMMKHPESGFMGVSRRQGRKPVIAAVNGFALGGGFEICLGCDMIVASPRASFGLPEASRGLYAAAGGLSRLTRIAGPILASEIAIAGRVLAAAEAATYSIINRVSKTHESLLGETIKLASCVANLSPDAILVTRSGIREALETGSVERASQLTEAKYGEAMRKAPNFGIGLEAFASKQKPQWVPSKL